LKADAVTEIQSGLATAAALLNLDGDVADVFDDVGAVRDTVDLILADTGSDGVVIANDGITAAKIAADAITEIQAGLATSLEIAALPTADENADSIWDEAIAGHAGVGSTGAALSAATAPSAGAVADAVWDEASADHVAAGSTGKALSDAGAAGNPWEAETRTLTQTAAAVVAAVSGSNLTIARGDTFSATLTGLPANTGYVSIDFTVKRRKSDPDTGAVIRIRKNASGLTDGLRVLNGADASARSANGSITVNSATSLTIALDAEETDDLNPDSLVYDIQYIFANTVQTATEGACSVNEDITRLVV